MREYLKTIIFAIIIAPANLLAQDAIITRSISYACEAFDSSENLKIKMKEYFDPKAGYTIGKLDTYANEILTDSISTIIYEITLSDNQSMMKMWYSKNTRVEAHLLISDKNNIFDATFVKSNIRQAINCTKYINH